MGLFSFFKITESDEHNEHDEIEESASVSQRLMKDVTDSMPDDKTSNKLQINTDIKKSDVALGGINFHPDIKDLLWFADGPLKNIHPGESIKNFSHGRFTITFSILGMEEPSMIFCEQAIEIPRHTDSIERPPYYPTYSALSPMQKGMYLKFLENPYRDDIDIGFVFILYYGLERHLLLGNWRKAVDVVIKLRDCHKNKSFQQYSAYALILTAMYRAQGEIAIALLASLDKDYEIQNFPTELYLMCASSFNLHITARDLMRMAPLFGFNNKLYIKKNPDLFEKTLSEKISELRGRDYILISDYLSENELNTLKKHNIKIFANTSLRDTKIEIPFITENKKLQEAFYYLLSTAHESVKNLVAEIRRNSCLKPEQKKQSEPKKQKTIAVDYLKQIYDLAVQYSMQIDYSEFCKCPGYNIIEIIPKTATENLEYNYNDIGYNELTLSKTDIKEIVNLWGEPEHHSTLNKMYHDLWHEYEIKYKKENPI